MTFRCFLLGVWVVAATSLGCGTGPELDETTPTVALPMPNSPLVTIRIGFRVGSIHEPESQKGLNALTALMMGRGGTASMSYEELTERLYPWSASISAQFDKEMTVLVGEVHRDHLDPFVT